MVFPNKVGRNSKAKINTVSKKIQSHVVTVHVFHINSITLVTVHIENFIIIKVLDLKLGKYAL